jgi:hypothetical protein
MGAKSALLVMADDDPAGLLSPPLAADGEATSALVARANPSWTGSTTAGSSLGDACYPPNGVVYAGSFPGIDILCDQQVLVDRPSELPAHLLGASAKRRVILVAMYSATDWLAYAVWEDGALVRSLSLSPDSGVIEDTGTRLPFEDPFWAGQNPVARRHGQHPYPLPFHPLELGQAALRGLVGFVIEGRPLPADIDADAVPLAGFEVPDPDPISEADLREFMRTHQRASYPRARAGQ